MIKKVPLSAGLSSAYFLLTLTALASGFIFLVYLPLSLLSFVWKPAMSVANQVLLHSLRLILAIQPWLKLEIQGTVPDLLTPSRRLIFLPNHRSTLDPFIVLSQVPGIRLLAKSSLFWVPILGAGMAITRQIPVVRGSIARFLEAMEIVRERLRDGERICIFPEMTRCPPGFSGLLPFNTAPFHAAIQEDAEIVPVILTRTDGVWPKGSLLIRPGIPVTCRFLDPVAARNFSSATELREHIRSTMLAALECT